MRKNLLRGLAVVAAAGLSTVAGATGTIDTTAALASIADAQTAILAVGIALIGVAAVVMGLRWAKAMFF